MWRISWEAFLRAGGVKRTGAAEVGSPCPLKKQDLVKDYLPAASSLEM